MGQYRFPLVQTLTSANVNDVMLVSEKDQIPILIFLGAGASQETSSDRHLMEETESVEKAVLEVAEKKRGKVLVGQCNSHQDQLSLQLMDMLDVTAEDFPVVRVIKKNENSKSKSTGVLKCRLFVQ